MIDDDITAPRLPIMARVAAWKMAVSADPDAFPRDVAERAAQPMIMGNPSYTGGDSEIVEIAPADFIAQVVDAGIPVAAFVADAVAAAAAPSSLSSQALSAQVSAPLKG